MFLENHFLQPVTSVCRLSVDLQYLLTYKYLQGVYTPVQNDLVGHLLLYPITAEFLILIDQKVLTDFHSTTLIVAMPAVYCINVVSLICYYFCGNS